MLLLSIGYRCYVIYTRYVLSNIEYGLCYIRTTLRITLLSVLNYLFKLSCSHGKFVILFGSSWLNYLL